INPIAAAYFYLAHLKFSTMKKLLILFAAAFLLSTSVHAQDTSKNKTTTGKSTKMKEYVTMQNGKLMVTKNGTTTEMTQDMTLSNGSVVMKDGKVKTKEGKMITLKEGERVYMNGKIKTMTEQKAKP